MIIQKMNVMPTQGTMPYRLSWYPKKTWKAARKVYSIKIKKQLKKLPELFVIDNKLLIILIDRLQLALSTRDWFLVRPQFWERELTGKNRR